MLRLYKLLAVFLVLAVAGCAGTRCYIPTEGSTGRDVIHLDGVRVFEQDKYRCGPAAMASMLAFSGVELLPRDLEQTVYDPESRGSLQVSLVAAARRNGRIAYEIKGKDILLESLCAGFPVLVLLNKGFSWWPVYHYSVVTGFDRKEGFFIIAGGTACEEMVPGSLFMRMWRRADFWGLLVLAPDDIPPAADPDKWIKAVYGLERMGAYEAALSGYKAALEKWPDAAGAMMGKANTLYAMGKTEEAAGVLERAAKIYPESGPVLNNLAHVKLELGELEKAFDAAVRAVKTGGPNADTYRQTLQSVKKAMNEDSGR
ncbi:MAG: PA2778 family cysteine peptidase [Desulfobacteraceae bacterium]|nr:PA2778 family cysteine peptidase [Desulfobacteraceae bacterium]